MPPLKSVYADVHWQVEVEIRSELKLYHYCKWADSDHHGVSLSEQHTAGSSHTDHMMSIRVCQPEQVHRHGLKFTLKSWAESLLWMSIVHAWHFHLHQPRCLTDWMPAFTVCHRACRNEKLPCMFQFQLSSLRVSFTSTLQFAVAIHTFSLSSACDHMKM